jgi:hypothetical protein
MTMVIAANTPAMTMRQVVSDHGLVVEDWAVNLLKIEAPFTVMNSPTLLN